MREKADRVEGQDGQKLERVAGRGHEPPFEAARGAHEDDPNLGVASAESVRDRKPGEEVAPGAACGDEEDARHSVRMLGHVQDQPTETSVKSRDEPPR
jgi:hypothetical protein